MTRISGPRAHGLTLVGAVALMALAAACTTGGSGSPAPTPVKIYESNLSPLPGNVSSQGFQCCQTSEFGDQIQFAGTARNLQSATVTMSNWAIHSTLANQSFGDAVGWDQQLTLNIYAVGANDGLGNPTKGAPLGTRTQTFHIPWRPEPDPTNCPTKTSPGYEYKFQAAPGPADSSCFNGLANQVTFDLSALHLTAPSQVVWGVAYNTQSYGLAPTGQDGPYNSLNVGAQGSGATVGTDVDVASAWIQTAFNPFMCDNGAGGTNVFRPDVCAPGSDWTGLTPEISFMAT